MAGRIDCRRLETMSRRFSKRRARTVRAEACQGDWRKGLGRLRRPETQESRRHPGPAC